MREGYSSKELLSALLEDFMITVVQDSANGGKYAYVTSLSPGEDFWAAFLDWVHNDPITALVDEALAWRSR